MPSPREPVDQSQNARRASGSKPGGRLVEEEQLRTADDAQGDVEPAALAAGQRRVRGPAFSVRPTAAMHLVGVARVAGSSRAKWRDAARATVSWRGRPRSTAARCRCGCARPARVAAGRRRARAPRRGRACGSPRGSRRWSSCPRRWGRAAAKTSPVLDVEVEAVDGVLVAVVLVAGPARGPRCARVVCVMPQRLSWQPGGHDQRPDDWTSTRTDCADYRASASSFWIRPTPSTRSSSPSA